MVQTRGPNVEFFEGNVDRARQVLVLVLGGGSTSTSWACRSAMSRCSSWQSIGVGIRCV
jgi:hypothetical protein